MDAINIIRQESVKLLQMEQKLLNLIDTEPRQIPENQNFTMDYLKGLGITLVCGIVTLWALKDLFTVGDILAKLIGLVLIAGFGFATFTGLLSLKATKSKQEELARTRQEAEDFNAKLDSDKATLAKTYNEQLEKLRTAKQLVPELRDRPIFFDHGLEHTGPAGGSYGLFKNAYTYVRISGEPVLRIAHFNDRDTLIYDGTYPDKHCLVKETLEALSKQDYYYLVRDDALIAQNLDSVCCFNLITDNHYFEHYLQTFVGGDTAHDPHLRLAAMPIYYNYTAADTFISGGIGGNFNYSSVPDKRDEQTPATEIPKRIDPKEQHMRHRNYDLLTLRLGYMISIPNPWRILCVAVPRFAIREQFWSINTIKGFPDKYDERHLVGELISIHDELLEKSEIKDIYPDPVRVAEYLVTDSYRLKELPPFDPFDLPPDGMNPHVWRTILRTWSTARPVVQGGIRDAKVK